MKSTAVLLLLACLQLAECWLCEGFRPPVEEEGMPLGPELVRLQDGYRLPGNSFSLISVLPLVQKITVEHRHVHVHDDDNGEQREEEPERKKKSRKRKKDTDNCALCGVCKTCALPEFLKHLEGYRRHQTDPANSGTSDKTV